MNLATGFSKVYRTIQSGSKDFRELGQPNRNMWLNEFITYVLIKNYFKFCMKEYVIRIVGIDIKIMS